MANKRFLLDTQILLWWESNDNRLSQSIITAIANPQNSVWISVVSFWEISIKLRTSPKFILRASFAEITHQPQFELLDITLEHVKTLHRLPRYHKDPFDRMLIAQSLTEKLTLITTDQKIAKYKVAILQP